MNVELLLEEQECVKLWAVHGEPICWESLDLNYVTLLTLYPALELHKGCTSSTCFLKGLVSHVFHTHTYIFIVFLWADSTKRTWIYQLPMAWVQGMHSFMPTPPQQPPLSNNSWFMGVLSCRNSSNTKESHLIKTSTLKVIKSLYK